MPSVKAEVRYMTPNTSTTRHTDVSVNSSDPSSIKTGTEQERIDQSAEQSAERANNRINADKGNVPGTQIFTK